MKRSRQDQGRINQNRGGQGESIAANVLFARGLAMVEKIGTPTKKIPLEQSGKKLLRKLGINTRDLYHVKFGEKVSGDRRAIIPEYGISVLVEVKTRLDSKLSTSDFEKHQLQALTTHVENGGISLIVWVHESGVYVLNYPINGWGKNYPLSPEQARIVDIQYIPGLIANRIISKRGNDYIIGIEKANQPEPRTSPKPDPIQINFAMQDICSALQLDSLSPVDKIELFQVVQKIMGGEYSI